MKIRIGSRQSELAKWQANYVAGLLRDIGCEVELVWLVTDGDVSTGPLTQSAGVGVFTKAIQRALLERRCDVAVHSLKDLPTTKVDGLVVAASPKREDARDCFLSDRYAGIQDLPLGATVGTGSPRRIAQLLRLRPDLKLASIRGNVETRIRKQQMGEHDAIILAAAGLHRLGLQSHIRKYFTPEEMLPAVGQAALGLECRDDDEKIFDVLKKLNDELTWQAVSAERTVLRELQAGCLAPMGVHAVWQEESLRLDARLLSTDGSRCLEAEVARVIDADFDGTQLGLVVADRLRSQGAAELL